MYLAPEVCVYRSFAPVLALIRERGVVVARTLNRLPEDGERPNYHDLIRAGQISSAIVGVDGSETALSFLRWWSQCVNLVDANGTQWLDLTPQLFPTAGVLEDPGWNVSFWNLHERPLARLGEEIVVGGSPLRSFYFAGFRPDRPYWLSDGATRVHVVDDPVLVRLCGDYAERVRGAGWTPPLGHMGNLVRLGNGQRVDHLVRKLWEEALASGQDLGDPLSPSAARAFVSWMRDPAAQGAAAGVNRYLFAAYQTRPDLQKAFPDLDGPDGERLIRWAWEHGRREVLSELLPQWVEDPGSFEAYRMAVNVVGYLHDTLGLAEAARLYVEALTAAGVPVVTTAVSTDLVLGDGASNAATRAGHRPYQELRADAEPAFNLVCLNGDHLEAFVRGGGEQALVGRPTIGQWGWETDVLPASWLGAFQYVDEVWVYSTFMAEYWGGYHPCP